MTAVDVAMVAVADEEGFERRDEAANVVGRADQIVVMWPGGGCADRGEIELAGHAAAMQLRLTRDFQPCAITVMDRVLLTMAAPVDARRIRVEHVALVDGAPVE